VDAALGTTTIPMATGLVVAVGAFLAWVGFVVRRPPAEPLTTATTVAVAPGAAAADRQVRAVIRPHYTVAAPDDDAVRVAMARRVRPPVPMPAPLPAPAEVEPVGAGLARSA